MKLLIWAYRSDMFLLIVPAIIVLILFLFFYGSISGLFGFIKRRRDWRRFDG